MMFEWIGFFISNSTWICAAMALAWFLTWTFRKDREDRMYDGVPKPVIQRAKEINNGLIPHDMMPALKEWLPKGEDYTLTAEVVPIFRERDHDPTWCVRVKAKGDGIDSGFDALFNRHGEIFT